MWRRRRHPHSCLLAWRNPMDRGARRATVRGVAESQTRLKRLGSQRVLRYCRFFQIIRGSGNEPRGSCFDVPVPECCRPSSPCLPSLGDPVPPPPPPALAVGWENLSSAKCQSSTWAGVWLHPCSEPCIWLGPKKERRRWRKGQRIPPF